jgi:hypothetical protein
VCTFHKILIKLGSCQDLSRVRFEQFAPQNSRDCGEDRLAQKLSRTTNRRTGKVSSTLGQAAFHSARHTRLADFVSLVTFHHLWRETCLEATLALAAFVDVLLPIPQMNEFQ